jgi:hypothetical protein
MALDLVQETTKQAYRVALHGAPGLAAADTATAQAPWLTPVTYHAIDIDEPSEKPRFDCRKVPVQLTVMGAGDAVLCATEGLTALNRARVQRLVYEAVAQGGILSEEDLAFLLGMSSESVAGMLAHYAESGDALPCRG